MTNFSAKWDKEEGKTFDDWFGDLEIPVKSMLNKAMDILDKLNHPHSKIDILGGMFDFTIRCCECDFTFHYKAWWKIW